jgi:uncharacterized protein (DUF1330 family)
MAAYVIAIINVTDPDAYQRYQELAPPDGRVLPTIAKYGGRYLARGGRSEVLEGEAAAERLVLVEFESYEKAKEWWTSPEYEAAKPFRQRSTTSTIMLVEGLS